MKMRPDGRVKYSASEKRAFSLLRPQEQSTHVLCRKFYGAKKRLPYHSGQIIVNLMASLTRKAAINRESFRVAKSRRAGPHPITFWLEPRA